MPPKVPVVSAPPEWTADLVPFVEAKFKGALGASGTRLVVDLSGTTFIASAGLTSLIHAGKRLADAGGALALARPTPPIVKLLRAVGLMRVLPAFDGLDEATAFAATARMTKGSN